MRLYIPAPHHRLVALAALMLLLIVSLPSAAQSAQPAACLPGQGWQWAYGDEQPAVAQRLRRQLQQLGLQASVTARSFGERDSCGTFHQHAVDLSVKLAVTVPSAAAQTQLYQQIEQQAERAVERLGRLDISFAMGEPLRRPQQPTVAAHTAATPSTATYQRNVYVVTYDPLLSNGKLLSEHLGWSNHTTITTETVAFFREASHNRLEYIIAATTVITDGWPVKIDGFRYTEAEYLDLYNDPSKGHEPDNVDYNAIVNDPRLDICGKANRNEIDEVWIYNGPWFGFYESTLVGPDGYWFNSPPAPEPHNCQRLIPIMGPSLERSSQEAIHNFGHRTESVMRHIFGSWEQNRTAHDWERFALLKHASPNYSYSGCGNVHFPPNSTIDYTFDDPAVVPSNCTDFVNYPNLGDPQSVVKPTTCSDWGCDEIGFYTYWFGNLPRNQECIATNFGSDWWAYILKPELANQPTKACLQHATYAPLIGR